MIRLFLQTKILFCLGGFLGRALFNFKWEIFLLRFLGWKTKSIHNLSLLSRVTDWWVGVQGLTVKMLWKLITMMLYLWHACVVTHFGRSVHLLYLPGVLCKLSVQCFKYNYVVMLINVRRVFCFYSFGCGEPVHEPVRCAVSNQNHVVFLCLWVYILPILWAAYADQCLYLSNYAVENFFFKSWLPELKREVYPSYLCWNRKLIINN